jgi:hypothetical protein
MKKKLFFIFCQDEKSFRIFEEIFLLRPKKSKLSTNFRFSEGRGRHSGQNRAEKKNNIFYSYTSKVFMPYNTF